MTTNAVIKLLKDINNKDSFKFIKMTIKDFYSSITKETLNAAIVFAQTNTNISNDNIKGILRKFSTQKVLVVPQYRSMEKKSEYYFDVTMGSHDSPEVHEFVGIFVLSHLAKIIN